MGLPCSHADWWKVSANSRPCLVHSMNSCINRFGFTSSDMVIGWVFQNWILGHCESDWEDVWEAQRWLGIEAFIGRNFTLRFMGSGVCIPSGCIKLIPLTCSCVKLFGFWKVGNHREYIESFWFSQAGPSRKILFFLCIFGPNTKVHATICRFLKVFPVIRWFPRRQVDLCEVFW